MAAAMTFERAVEFVLRAEGGYIFDQQDSGGETNFGISKRSYPALDIKNLARATAIEIYRHDYWDACRCGELPHGLDLLVFDCAVNQGVSTAIRTLQQVAKVMIDGRIGPVTLAAAREVSLTEYATKRQMIYVDCGKFQRYGQGWTRRLMRCLAEAVVE